MRRAARALALGVTTALAVAPLSLVTASPAHAATPIDIQIIGTNDFHGRIGQSGVEAGAASMATAVKGFRTANPNTVFAAAGDLIGASTFESFIAKDKPTLDSLNSAGLEVSSVGNHEFDQGYDDLVNRVMKPYDATTNPYGGAGWQYIAANVHKAGATGDQIIPPTWTKTMGGVKVGFIGAVTEHLPELVSPGGIAGVSVENIVAATNREANALKAGGAQIIVLLVHEGASTPAYADAVNPTSDFGKVVTGVNDNVDAIISGHTHLTYNHAVPVPGWAGRAVTSRPVVSAGQYGYNLDRLVFQWNPDTQALNSITSTTVPMTTTVGTTVTQNYAQDGPTAAIVSAAVAQSNVLGAVPLGSIAGPFNRAKLADGSTENRGGESTAGNLVAEAQRWATSSATTGSAQIAFMNPGGLRADLLGNNTAGYPAVLTYKQAAVVQPFANTLVNMRLTGAQIRKVLEQQWQPAGAARPFLKLGTSVGFSYVYDPAGATGAHVKSMSLNGQPITDAATYSVTVNSFLSTGGDNFLELANGTQKKDTGKTDLQGMVDYMAAFAATTPLAVAYDQRSVGVSYPAGAPTSYGPGDKVAFNLSSLAFSTAADKKDTSVTVALGSQVLGTFPVDNTIGTAITDEYGKAAVSVTIPTYAGPAPAQALTVKGATTGTSVAVPVALKATKFTPKLVAKVKTKRVVVKKTKTKLKVAVKVGGKAASGKITVFSLGKKYTGKLKDGKLFLKLPVYRSTGKKVLRVKFLGSGTVHQESVKVKLFVHKTK